MRHRFLAVLMFVAAQALAWPAAAGAQQTDYLTRLEADRVRDAETSNDRIKLFLGFAADRLRKFQYDFAKPNPDRRRVERLNEMLDQLAFCLDDAAELVQLGTEKSEDVRKGAEELQVKSKEYLEFLEKLLAEQKVPAMRDHIEDAIFSAKAALRDAEKALKEIAPGPVRRKP